MTTKTRTPTDPTTSPPARGTDPAPAQAAGTSRPGPALQAAARRGARLRPFRTPVRGHAFAAPPDDGVALSPGLAARLAREPANPADPLAVAVWADADDGARWRIGYLDRGVAARLAPRLDAGQGFAVEFDGWVGEPEGRWQRPVVRLVPDVPEPAAPRPGDRAPLWGRPPGVTVRRVRRR
jgi:hypothetical protein